MSTDGAVEPPKIGLREKHRLQTLSRLEEVALRLFVERGFGAVTVDDIAAEADVSRRTFFRYFAGKEDVLLTDHQKGLEQLRRALAERPAGEPALTALRRAVQSMASSYEDQRERLLRRAIVMRQTPSLEIRSLGHQRTGEQAVTDLMAEWLGVDPVKDLRPGVVAATTMGALRVAFNAWLADGGESHLPTLVDEALDLLDGGLQQGVNGSVAKPPRRSSAPRQPSPKRAKAG